MIYPPVQIVGLLVLFVTIVLYIYWVRHNRRYVLWLIPLLAWLFHGAIFYAVTVFGNLNGLVVPNIIFFTDWSSIVRLQGYLAMMMYSVALIIYYPGDRHVKRDNSIPE
jgi:hypothetical protein